MPIDTNRVETTVEITVLVQFRQNNGALYQGDFKGTFNRLPVDEIDEMIDADPAPLNSEIVDRVLVGVRGIGNGATELPPEEALAWVKKSPECVNAAVAAFFKELRPERYNEKTSRKRR